MRDRFTEYMERAEQQWEDMSLREKIAAIDPDNERELLMEYVEWQKKRNFSTWIDPRDFIDETYKWTWVEQEAQAMMGDEADRAYDYARDEGLT